MSADEEEKRLRSVALSNVQTILQARQRAEQQLLETKEALEEETRILELLNKTGAMLASKLDLPALVLAVTDAGTQLSGAQLGSFSDTFRGAHVVRIADALTDPRYEQMGPDHGMPAGHPPVRSYLAVPVMTQSGDVIGGLFFGHAEPNVFTERSERLIVGIAAQSAIALDNARLYEEAKRAADDRSRLLEAERAARAEVERISLIKDEFLATLSHELRTPLNAVLGWSEILLARAEEETDLQRGLQTIARNARAQAQLIDDLLDMNRIVSGKIRLDVQRIDLASIVEAVLESLRPSAEAKGIAFRETIDPNAGPMLGDPNRLQQIVWNLLNNAVKFTPKGGSVDVVVQRVSSQLEVRVHDSGIGISPAFLPHLFERFRQADSSTTRKYGGLGLGLSIVKQLVELHGGSVTADSEGEGRGATFTVSLPVRAVREPTPSSREHPTTSRSPLVRPPEVSLAGIKVLVIDDETDARDLAKSVLTDAGAEVMTAASADAGLALVKSRRPDAIVSDIGMPDRDGYDFIRDVRSLSTAEGGRTPAVALTAFARSEDRTRAMLAGYQVHVSKPIEPQELVATIKSLAWNIGDRNG